MPCAGPRRRGQSRGRSLRQVARRGAARMERCRAASVRAGMVRCAPAAEDSDPFSDMYMAIFRPHSARGPSRGVGPANASLCTPTAPSRWSCARKELECRSEAGGTRRLPPLAAATQAPPSKPSADPSLRPIRRRGDLKVRRHIWRTLHPEPITGGKRRGSVCSWSRYRSATYRPGSDRHRSQTFRPFAIENYRPNLHPQHGLAV